MLGGKSVVELESMREDIQKKLERGGRDVDGDYWAKVLGKCALLPSFLPSLPLSLPPSLPPAFYQSF